ncbi:MAG: hypothetical protein ACNA70_00195 [Brevefilum sp.]
MPESVKKPNSIYWSGTSYVMLSGFLLLLFLIGYVWWPLLDEYLNQFNPEISIWLQIDWLLIGNFLVMSILIMLNADLKKDLPFALIALAGGFVIEAWGTLSGLWSYYTFETPPLWIIPAWPIAALAVNRLYMLVSNGLNHLGKGWSNFVYWPIYGVFYLLLWRFAWEGIQHPLTWFALGFCGVIILAETDKRSSLLILLAGSALGYFLERWGTTRLCWAYHTGGWPPLITVLSHGMASVAIWRVYRVYLALLNRSGFPLAKHLIPMK